MKKEYDFTEGRRGVHRNLPPIEEIEQRTKVRITIMLDRDVLEHFKAAALQPGADPYQTQINRALRGVAFPAVHPEDKLLTNDGFIDRVAERVAARSSIRRAVSARRGRAGGKR